MFHGYRELFSLHKNKRYLLNIAKNVETRFDTSIYELDRPLLTGKNKKLIALIKN